MSPPEKRSPAVPASTDRAGKDQAPQLIVPDHIAIEARQATILHRRFGLSWPTARAVAALHFEHVRAA